MTELVRLISRRWGTTGRAKLPVSSYVGSDLWRRFFISTFTAAPAQASMACSRVGM